MGDAGQITGNYVLYTGESFSATTTPGAAVTIKKETDKDTLALYSQATYLCC